jgi:hypothetical protein
MDMDVSRICSVLTMGNILDGADWATMTVVPVCATIVACYPSGPPNS